MEQSLAALLESGKGLSQPREVFCSDHLVVVPRIADGRVILEQRRWSPLPDHLERLKASDACQPRGQLLRVAETIELLQRNQRDSLKHISRLLEIAAGPAGYGFDERAVPPPHGNPCLLIALPTGLDQLLVLFPVGGPIVLMADSFSDYIVDLTGDIPSTGGRMGKAGRTVSGIGSFRE